MTTEQVWDALAETPDPEIPVISLVDLGVIRDVAVDGDHVRVEFTPTFMSWKAPNHFQYSFELPTSSAPHERRSAPTQKARPSPVTTTTRISSSQLASSHARAISRSIRKSNAFRTSGRLSRMVARGGAFS